MDMSKLPTTLREVRSLAAESGMAGVHKIETMKLESRIQDLEARIARLEHMWSLMKNSPDKGEKVSEAPPRYGASVPVAPLRPLF